MASKVSEASLTCSICLGLFVNPRILPCLHSFCEDCLLTWAPMGTGKVPCPLCQEVADIPEGDVTKFKANFHLSGQVEDARRFEAHEKTHGAKKAGATATFVCTCCPKKADVIARCLTCDQYLCQAGVDAHNHMEALKDHTVATLEELRSEKIIRPNNKDSYSRTQLQDCPNHPGEKTWYFCHTCNEFICRECTVLDHPRPDHRLTSLEDAAKEIRQIASQMMSKILKIREEAIAEKGQIETIEKDLETDMDSLRNQIKNSAESAYRKIENEERRLLEEVKRFQDDKLECDATRKARKDKSIERAKQVIDMAKSSVEDANDHDFLSLWQILRSKMEQVCDARQEADIRPTPTSLTFSPTVPSHTSLGRVVKLIQEIRTQKHTDKFHFEFANGIAVCNNSDFVVADRDQACLAIFDTAGKLKKVIDSRDTDEGKLNKLRDVDVTTDGTLAVVDFTEYVKMFNANTGAFVRRFTTLRETEDPKKTESYLYCVRVYHRQDKEVVLAADWKRKVVSMNLLDGSLCQIISLDVTPRFMGINKVTKQVLISDYEEGQVTAIDLDGKTQFTFNVSQEGKVTKASGICCDDVGNIYVGQHIVGVGNAIYQYNNRGNFVSCIAKGLTNPLNSVFTSAGKLVVADRNAIKIFSLA